MDKKEREKEMLLIGSIREVETLVVSTFSFLCRFQLSVDIKVVPTSNLRLLSLAKIGYNRETADTFPSLWSLSPSMLVLLLLLLLLREAF